MKLIQILKGVLLWMTALSFFCFIAGGFESLIDAERWLPAFFWLVINIALGYTCYCNISHREMYKLSGSQWFDKLLRH